MEAIWSFHGPFQLKVIIDARKQGLESDPPVGRDDAATRRGDSASCRPPSRTRKCASPEEIDCNFLRGKKKRRLMPRRQNVITVLGLASPHEPLSHRDKSSGVEMIRHRSRSIYSENISPLILCLGSRRMNQRFSADGASCDSKKTHNAPIRTTNNWSGQWFKFKCNGKASHYSLCHLHLGMFTIQTPGWGEGSHLQCIWMVEFGWKKRWQSNC